MTRRKHPLHMPTAVWQGKDLLDGKPVNSLTIIFHTTGCSWSRRAGCTMCGYFNDTAATPPTDQDLISQMEHAMDKAVTDTALIKIFTSGSFFDDTEIPQAVRSRILERIGDAGNVSKIVAETRPEFVSEINLGSAIEILDRHNITLEIAMGLETSSDTIRKECINKGFTFNDFTGACQTARSMGVSTKAYLLLKPPFLSERTAINDILASISDTAPYAATISLNLCNVQKGTPVESQYNRGDYRPPWLWSAVHILKIAKAKFPGLTFMSDPVAAGSARGPHNCRKCDGEVAQMLRDFSIKQDVNLLSGVECDCYPLWEKVVELEEDTFGSFLVK